MIIIDPGHGGQDAGAVSGSIKEKDWALELSLYQYERFRALHVPVRLTRQQDVALAPENRASLVKNSGASICISNHFNAGGGEGVETIHSIYSDGVLATHIAKAIHKAGQPFRKVYTKKGSNGKDYYFMHRLTGKVETIIVEYGFLDHQADVSRLSDRSYRESLAEAVVQAVCSFLNIKTAEPRLYTVQVGAFRELEHAKQLMEELKHKGFPAILK